MLKTSQGQFGPSGIAGEVITNRTYLPYSGSFLNKDN